MYPAYLDFSGLKLVESLTLLTVCSNLDNRGGDYFGYAHHATASSNAMSTCRVNEFATGVTTWYDSAGVTAIRLECAEVVPDTACVPPNLHERKSREYRAIRGVVEQGLAVSDY